MSDAITIKARISTDRASADDDKVTSLAMAGIVTVLVPRRVFYNLVRGGAAEPSAAAGIMATAAGVRVVRQPNGPYLAFDHEGNAYKVEWGD